MIKSSHFLHYVDALDVNLRNNHVEIIARVKGRNVSEFAVFGEPLAPDTLPALRFDGVDVPALLEAARAALRALNEAHEGNPIALPLGVTEARACLLSVLEARQ
jgi:hypothetical protein